MIAFLGMGLLGANFVRALRKRGEDVNVWNRTTAKARILEADGAHAFEDPAEATRGATRIHVTLSDDAAVDDVLERARPGIGERAIIVDHSTTSPGGVKDRHARWTERGVSFLHAPVFMGPQNALDSTGIMLASGDATLFSALKPALETMTGRLVYLEGAPERAASFKLLGNMFLMFLTSGMADVLALGKAVGFEPADTAKIFEIFNPAAMIAPRVKRILDNEFEKPSWELAMARKDARLMLEAAARGGVELAVVPAIAKEMDRWIALGHGNDDWTVIAKGALEKSGE
jgi:3-hydroxyisobutyrate dehydrogenase